MANLNDTIINGNLVTTGKILTEGQNVATEQNLKTINDISIVGIGNISIPEGPPGKTPSFTINEKGELIATFN